MSAYVVVDIDVHDPEGYEGYKKRSGDAVAKYGGRYLVRGGRTETLEGEWDRWRSSSSSSRTRKGRRHG